jgi:DNA replication protein DnaC
MPKPKPDTHKLRQPDSRPKYSAKPNLASDTNPNAAVSQPPDDNLLLERLRKHLAFLGLNQTVSKLDELLDWATRQRPGYTALLEHVLSLEVDHKSESRIAHRIQSSGLLERKTLEAFDWDFQPTIDKPFFIELGRLDFVRRRDDLIITGKSGTGKSHLLKAFGLRACEQGMSVRYARCVDLLDDLHAGLADQTYPQRLKAWTKPSLLIIDDVGLGQVRKRSDEPTAAHTLYNLIDRRHAHCSTAVSSNIHLSNWGRYLGDATVATAILDRLAMHAIRVDIDGPSYRQREGAALAKRLGTKIPKSDPSTTEPIT